MTNGTAVLGTGARTAIGENAPATMAAARAGIGGFHEHPYMISQSGEPYVLAWAPYVDPDLQGLERQVELALPAAREALAPLAELKLNPPAVSVFVGLPAARPGVPADAAAEFGRQLTAKLNERFPVTVEVLPSGHSAGLMALERAVGVLRGGKEGVCLVGGVDSYVEPDALEWVESSQRLHSPDNPYGFIPGEAAGFLLLAGPDVARRHPGAVQGEILAAATAQEKSLLGTDAVCTGQGLTEAFRRALQGSPAKVDEVICDANGEPYRADEYGFALARVSERFVRASDFVAPADCWGDVGAASGPLLIARACAAARKEYSRGPLSLVWTSSDGGQRSAALIHAALRRGGSP